ncbi:ribosomal L28e protein family-domain-containing protein [Russula earlei]|uniref:Ribosomal L28e protein family-domain-containing protein n=1 Tax=Russula earlei TaxID=71964 RepID=A0ACC0UMZ3_9AGAM|nr:ribosomal L28e protein family-domain-containing protein [Russula earlei]
MSSDLEWLLLRGNNSFIVKRAPSGPIFSKEPGNLLNIHSQKFSGLANAKTIDVKPSSNGFAITHRKKSASTHAVRLAYASTIIGSRTGSRRALGIAAQLAKRGYRPDLRAATIARVSALIVAQKEPRAVPPKKLRGRKAKAFEISLK